MPEVVLIHVEVAFALPDRQWVIAVRVPAGATVAEAITSSGIVEHLGELRVDDDSVGIFSLPARLDDVVADGDRIEIYRPLTRDPKDMRRLRARGQGKR